MPFKIPLFIGLQPNSWRESSQFQSIIARQRHDNCFAVGSVGRFDMQGQSSHLLWLWDCSHVGCQNMSWLHSLSLSLTHKHLATALARQQATNISTQTLSSIAVFDHHDGFQSNSLPPASLDSTSSFGHKYYGPSSPQSLPGLDGNACKCSSRQ